MNRRQCLGWAYQLRRARGKAFRTTAGAVRAGGALYSYANFFPQRPLWHTLGAMKFNRTAPSTSAPIAPEMKVANPLLSFRITQVAFYLALSIFFGGLVVLGTIVAGELFSTLTAAHVQVASMNPQLDQAKLLAGRVFGRILHVFDYVELGCMFVMTVAVLLQMVLHFHLKKLWVWVRFFMLALLAFLVLRDIWVLFPAIRHQQQLWLQNVPGNLALAKVHKAKFDTLHAESEHGGIIEMFLLLGILGVSAWGLNWPDRQRHAREIARRSGLMAVPPSPLGAATPASAATGAAAAYPGRYTSAEDTPVPATPVVVSNRETGVATPVATPAWPSVTAGHPDLAADSPAAAEVTPVDVPLDTTSTTTHDVPPPPEPLEEPHDAS